MEPLTAVSTAFITALTERSQSRIRRTLEVTLSLIILTLFLGMFLDTLSHEDITLDPVAGAYRMTVVMGVTDTLWLDSVVQWLERPALTPIAFLGSVISGIVVFWAARYSGEIVWLLLLAFSVTLGSQAFWLAGFSLVVTTAILGVAAWLRTRFEFEDSWRNWFGPGQVSTQAMRGFTLWLLAPFTIVFRLLNGVLNTVTYERRDVGIASGAVPLSTE